MEKYNQLKKLILESDLHSQEKEDLIWIFYEASEEETNSCLNLYSNDKEWIRRISDNYYSKQVALLADDVEMWKKILTEEENIVKRVGNDTLLIFDLITRHLYAKVVFSQHGEEKSEQQQMREEEEEERRNEDEERTKEVLENLLTLAHWKNMEKTVQKIEESVELPTISF